VQPGEDGNPSMHAWLRETLDEDTEDEAHWSFRALSHPNALAVQARLRRLLSFVNLDPAITKRHAVLLRNPVWPNGKVSQRMKQDYLDRGGMLTTVSADDVRTFAALAKLLDEHDPALPDWLLARRPAGNTALFGRVFGPPPDEGEVQKLEPAPTGSTPSTPALLTQRQTNGTAIAPRRLAERRGGQRRRVRLHRHDAAYWRPGRRRPRRLCSTA
jgi:hypothetical protein